MNSRSKIVPPPGAYRQRLCLACLSDLSARGYLTRTEDGAARGTCERCRRDMGVTVMVRYTKRWAKMTPEERSGKVVPR